MGRVLAESEPRPFEDTWESLLVYDRLPTVDYGRVDEFRWLAEQIVAGLEARGEGGEPLGEAKRLLHEARVHVTQGDVEGEAQKVVAAYRLGAQIWS